MLKLTTEELEKLLTGKNVIGDAIDLGNKAVLPVTQYGFGFGGGYGHNEAKTAGGVGSGAGGGINPVALVIVHKDVIGAEGIQVISLQKDHPAAQVISTISESLAPQLISAWKSTRKEEKVEKKEE